MAKIEKDDVTGTHTTGHEWDGIKELNTPLPRWWIMTFYASIVFAIGYMVLYPAWPMVHGATPGLLGYSSRAAVDNEIASAQDQQAQWLDKIKSANAAAILKNDDLRTFAKAAGAAAFKMNCVQCHGSGAQGAMGYPNLNDNDWIFGGTIGQIHQTITHGSRYVADPDTRQDIMPSFGTDGLLKPDQVTDVANYVWAFSGNKPDDQAAAERGKQVFAENCASCHGDAGRGNKDMGAPNLSDQIWLYMPGIAAIEAQVTKPRMGVMPAWGGKLDETRIKELAVYVYTLGGGEPQAE